MVGTSIVTSPLATTLACSLLAKTCVKFSDNVSALLICCARLLYSFALFVCFFRLLYSYLTSGNGAGASDFILQLDNAI